MRAAVTGAARAAAARVAAVRVAATGAAREGPSFEQIASMPGPGSQHGGAAVAATRHSMLLYAVAEACDGLSGRALRKLPFLAHALFGGGGGGGGGGDASAAQGGPMPIELYLVALRRAVEHERGARGALGGNAGP